MTFQSFQRKRSQILQNIQPWETVNCFYYYSKLQIGRRICASLNPPAHRSFAENLSIPRSVSF